MASKSILSQVRTFKSAITLGEFFVKKATQLTSKVTETIEYRKNDHKELAFMLNDQTIEVYWDKYEKQYSDSDNKKDILDAWIELGEANIETIKRRTADKTAYTSWGKHLESWKNFISKCKELKSN